MKKITLLLLSLLLANTSFAADKLNKSSATRLVQDFYDTLKSRNDKKLESLIANQASIKLTLLQMQQSFTLSKADYLQQIKAAWYFGKDDSYELDDIQYTPSTTGDTATVSFKLKSSRFILGETISQEDTVDMGLEWSDNALKIVSIQGLTH